ncbi:MAG TPA: prepilin-type N-terminal cleavage/methylation domain-containing protein [Chthoniobacteraceae bacterium]|nr:prepilin-type N-terminal cleavage/methylation domain-containing protein [Chthoniobacteraceae bacterium]
MQNRLKCSNRFHRSGLTLIEVMVALAVLVILVSGIFMVVHTALKTVLLIDNQASREDEITNLTDILRTNFRNLPNHALLSAGPVPGKENREFLFVVQNAPGFLTWLPIRGSDREVVLLSLQRPSREEGWKVCLKRFDPAPTPAEREFDAQQALKAAAQIPWLELVANIERVGVRFFDQTTRKWLQEWKNSHTRPGLIELTLVYEHTKDARSAAAIFWLPPVKGGTP